MCYTFAFFNILNSFVNIYAKYKICRLRRTYLKDFTCETFNHNMTVGESACHMSNTFWNSEKQATVNLL